MLDARARLLRAAVGFALVPATGAAAAPSLARLLAGVGDVEESLGVVASGAAGSSGRTRHRGTRRCATGRISS
jgi:hypothetical protein